MLWSFVKKKTNKQLNERYFFRLNILLLLSFLSYKSLRINKVVSWTIYIYSDIIVRGCIVIYYLLFVALYFLRINSLSYSNSVGRVVQFLAICFESDRGFSCKTYSFFQLTWWLQSTFLGIQTGVKNRLPLVRSRCWKGIHNDSMNIICYVPQENRRSEKRFTYA